MITLTHAPLEEDIMKVPGVTDVKPISEYSSRFRVWFDGDRETLSRMVDASVKNSWGLSEIQLEKISMNEVFAQLSGRKK